MRTVEQIGESMAATVAEASPHVRPVLVKELGRMSRRYEFRAEAFIALVTLSREGSVVRDKAQRELDINLKGPLVKTLGKVFRIY